MLKYNRPLVLIFIDFHQAFDTVNIEGIAEQCTIGVLEYACKTLNWERKGVNIDGEYLNKLR